MSVKAMDQSLNGWLVQVAQVGGGLARFLAHHQRLWVDQAECIDDNFALHGLNGIDNDGDGSWCELLKTLLGVDINRREPAAKTGMGVIPADDRFGPVMRKLISCRCRYGRSAPHSPASLPQHIHHLHLEDRVDSFYADARTTLRHGKHIHHADREVVHKLA